MLKKIITALSGMAILAGSASSVVSCVSPSLADGEDGQRVVLVTNGGTINDHSFNEISYKGVKDLLHDAYGNEANHSYVESQGFTTAAMISGYRLALVKEANMIVAPGFAHLDPLAASKEFLKNTNIILLDSSIKADNVVSITYNSQIAGFMAGFNTSVWATQKDEKGNLIGDANGDGKITIGAFMGASNKPSVDNYGWGLMLGMQVYNEMATRYNENKSGDAKRTLVRTGNDDSGEIKNLQAEGTTDQNFYTNSFTLGDATKSGVVPSLVDKRGSDVVFPIAGSQIEDVVGYTTRWSNGNKPYVIGVDTDATKSLPQAARQHRFVTSAIKDLDGAVSAAAYRAESDTRKNTLTFSEKTMKDNNPNNEKWLGTNPEPLAGWSVSLTNDDLKAKGEQEQYMLNHDFIKLFADAKGKATEVMKDINNLYNNTGSTPQDYFKGSVFVKAATALVDKYGGWDKLDKLSNDKDSKEVIDWTTK